MAFQGALIHKAHPNNQSVPDKSPTLVTFDTVIYDTDSFVSPTNPSRFVVPAGVSFVRLGHSQVWSDSDAGWNIGMRQVVILKNGAFYPGDPVVNVTANGGTTTDLQGYSAVLPVVEGDYFDAQAYQDTGGALPLWGSTGTWFSIEVLG